MNDLKINTDKDLSKIINQKLSQTINQQYKCISNSLMIQNQKELRIVYIAKNLNQGKLVLVVLSVSQEAKQEVRLVPIQTNEYSLPHYLSIQMLQQKFSESAFLIIVTDENKTIQNPRKQIYLTEFQLSSNEMIWHLCLKQKAIIHDVKWHPFVPFTMVLLFQDKISVYSFNETINEPAFEIYFTQLSKSLNSQFYFNNGFRKIAFAQPFQLADQYSSLGKKLTLYIISNKGEVFGLFPFICNGLLMDTSQKNKLNEILQFSNRNSRQLQLLNTLRKCQIQNVNDQEFKDSYRLTIRIRTSRTDYFTFKINNEAQNRQSSNAKQIGKSVQNFKVLTIGHHTVFIHCMVLKSYENILKIQVFSEDPYEKLLSSSNFKNPLHFAVETVAQVNCGQIDQQDINKQFSQFIQPFENNSIYLLNILNNNKICYKISLKGLVDLIKNNQPNIQQKLIDLDIIFQTQYEIVSLAKTKRTIYLLRHDLTNYEFTQIPLETIALKQIIRQTNQKTEQLFDRIVKQTQNQEFDNQQNSQKSSMAQLQQQNLGKIQEKLGKFTTDYQNSMDRKLERIQNLYQNMKVKQVKLQNYLKQKKRIIELVNEAQSNDQSIKSLLKNTQKPRSKREIEYIRQIQGLSFYVKNISEQLQFHQKQLQSPSVSTQQKQTMQQCEQQADGIINHLEGIYQRLLDRKRQG